VRAWAVLLLAALLAPLGQAGEGRGDLIVLVAPGSHVGLPAGALPLHVVPGFVVPDASDALARALAATPGVVRIQRGEPLELHGLPTAAAAAPDHALRLTRADPDDLAPFGADGTGVTVAVVDSGIDATHPDLAGRVAGNWRLVDGAFVPAAGDTNGHGTHVAGIVAASGASSGGAHAGTAPGATLVGLDILSQSFTTTSALLAYDWLHQNAAQQGIRVVVNAWGRTGEPRTFDPDDALIQAVDRVVDDGVVVVFSASNHGPIAGSLSVEAQDPRVVTVGAVDDAGQIAPYSSRGPVEPAKGGAWAKPDVVAPGDRVVGLRSQETTPDPATDPDALHREMSGTSQAAPHVAGLVARMLQANPRLAPDDVLRDLRESAIDLGPTGPDAAYGQGLVDAPDALRAALGQAPLHDNPLAAGGVETYDDATQAAANGGALSLAPAAQGAWETRIPIKEGATALAFEVASATPAPGLDATLTGPAGAAGSWSGASQEGSRTVLRGRLDALPPGVYTLRVTATLPIALESHAQVTLGARAAPPDPRYHLPQPPAAAQGVPARTLADDAILLARSHPWIAPALAAAIGLPLAWLAKRARRAPRPPGPDAPPADPQPSRDGST